ncbi:MAG: YajQ family cyclic di-GMP-binding protein [Bacteroidetes bacterium]|nr:MAG: YajQ family cyclic di-GMP-binding protein [Bacteroidota bacterium]
MPSFDIVSKVDGQLLDNAVNVATKEILNRFDFRDSQSVIDLNKKDMIITVETENDMRMRAIEDMLMTRAIKQGIDGRSFDFTKEATASGKIIKKTIKLKAGLEKEDSKKIVKIIKDSKIKVDAAIMDDQVRVTSKKIDDLQAIIQLLRKSDLGIPMQFINMK